MPLSIDEVALTDRPGLARFLDFPLALHKNDPAFVPALRLFQLRRLSPGNPQLREARLRLFAARRGDELLGTVSLLWDPRHVAHRGVAEAFFGFFECVDDAAVAAALLERVQEEARRAGAVRLLGPRNVTRVEDVGLLIDGYDQRPPMLASFHPPRYRAFIEAAGLRKRYDMMAYEAPLYDEAGRPRALPEGLLRKAAAARAALPGLSIRAVRWRSLGQDLRDSHDIFTAAYADVPEVVPMPRAQFLSLGRAFLAVADHDLMQIARLDSRPVAFVVCLPDVNEALHAARSSAGRLWPAGWLRLLSALRGVRTASFKLIGVVPALRHSGVHAVLIDHVVAGLRRAGYRRLEASLIHQDNAAMRKIVEGAGMTAYQTYRIFEKDLPLTAPSPPARAGWSPAGR